MKVASTVLGTFTDVYNLFQNSLFERGTGSGILGFDLHIHVSRERGERGGALQLTLSVLLFTYLSLAF